MTTTTVTHLTPIAALRPSDYSERQMTVIVGAICAYGKCLDRQITPPENIRRCFLMALAELRHVAIAWNRAGRYQDEDRLIAEHRSFALELYHIYRARDPEMAIVWPPLPARTVNYV